MIIIPQLDIAEMLLEEGVVQQGQVFLDYRPAWSEIGQQFDTSVTVRLTTGTSNPRWARDNLAITIHVSGRNRQHIEQVETLAYQIYNHLVGHPTVTRGDYVYTQFNSVAFPQLVGYEDNSMPLYTCSISLVREAQVKEGNRDPLC